VGPVWRRSTAAVALLAALAVVAALVGCSREQPELRRTAPAAADYARSMRKKVTADAIFAHLQRLQQIADANGGNRAVATPGYDASVEYIVKTLGDKGFDVQTPGFDFRQFESGEVSLTVNGETVPTYVLQYSAGTGPDGVSGPLVAAPAEDTPGCSASDYDGLPVSGAVVLVDRGSCQFSVKENVAVQRGAVGLVIADNLTEQRMSGTLGAQTDVKIPVVCVSKADGARLRTAPGATTIKVDAKVKTLKARNVIAQTKTGSTQNVVVVDAHLDSVAQGPGINHNGSGVAAVLETAQQMGPSPPIQNAVRFAFWGAEELGLWAPLRPHPPRDTGTPSPREEADHNTYRHSISRMACPPTPTISTTRLAKAFLFRPLASRWARSFCARASATRPVDRKRTICGEGVGGTRRGR